MPTTDERSIGDLFAELARETSTLVRQEMALARVEMGQKAAEAAKGGASVGTGGGVALMGGVVLTFAVVFLVAWILNQLFNEDFPFLALGLAALLVGGIAVWIGYGMLQKGLEKLRAIDPKPERTIQTLKEDKEWAKHQVT